jgi:hypothetical protein
MIVILWGNINDACVCFNIDEGGREGVSARLVRCDGRIEAMTLAAGRETQDGKKIMHLSESTG